MMKAKEEKFYVDVQRLATLHVAVLNAIVELSSLEGNVPLGTAISNNLRAARDTMAEVSRFLTWACVNNRKEK